MPNWVYNTVQVRGEAEQVGLFKDHIAHFKNAYIEDEDKFSFHMFITLPESKFEEYKTVSGFVGGEQSGDTEYNWYRWNTKNWHTKWDACEADITDDEYGVEISFNTAWSPPLPVFEAMAEQFPALSFYFYWEEEQEWGGEARGECGYFTITQEWDIPDSHADYEALGKECSSCCGWYENEPEKWYDDCPDKAEAIKKQKEDSMTATTIKIIGTDVNVGEVVESFMDNHLINDEALYEVESVEVFGEVNEWNRLTGAEITISADMPITNRYIDPIREQFPAVDIEVVND